MSIEKALADQTVAINENTTAVKALIAALAAGGVKTTTTGGSTGSTGSGSTKETKPPKSDLDRAKVNAALTEVKEKFKAPAAKAIIAEQGGVEKMADIPEDKFQAVYDACKKKMAEGAGSEEADI